MLNEFLGTEFGDQHWPRDWAGDHLARVARSAGCCMASSRVSSRRPAPDRWPATAPAQTFAGLAVNFGLAAHNGRDRRRHSVVPARELREMGEDVARNIGLGRLVRRALTPLIQILVAQPLTWAINTKYLPSQFSEPMLVNPYLAATLPHDQLYNAMHLLGYSDDKIQAFIQMHQKRLNPAEVKLLVDNNLWDQQTALTYITNIGYPAELAGTILTLEDIREEKGWVDKFIAALEVDVVRGVITTDEFESLLNGTPSSGTPGVITNTTGLPISQHIKDLILATVNYKVAAGKKTRAERLSEGSSRNYSREGCSLRAISTRIGRRAGCRTRTRICGCSSSCCDSLERSPGRGKAAALPGPPRLLHREAGR